MGISSVAKLAYYKTNENRGIFLVLQKIQSHEM